jgi:hypothetical protein
MVSRPNGEIIEALLEGDVSNLSTLPALNTGRAS